VSAIIESLFDYYNANRGDLPEARLLTSKRKAAINARLKECSEDDIKTVILKARDSDFLSGRDGKWQASFDWLLNPNNFIKVLEGNYDNRVSPKEIPRGYKILMDELEKEKDKQKKDKPYGLYITEDQ
jgi:hypothetical protein